MIDFRLYRAALLPTVIAVVVVAFSLQGIPGALITERSAAGFDAQRAVATARQIASDAPAREPGSHGDAVTADVVEKRFDAVEGGIVSEQRYDSSYEGEDVSLRNVILTLPGQSESTIVIVAARDSARGPGAVSSGAATAALLSLGDALGGIDHTKTIVLVSTDGGADGASGAREFASSYDDRAAIEAAIVVAQPAAASPVQPFLVTSSTADRSASIQLSESVARAIEDQVGERPRSEGALDQLGRLAMPSGLGEQAALIDEGIDAVAISSAGERQVSPAADGIDDVSGSAMAAFGRAALAAVLALDDSVNAPDHGPDSYVIAGNNLIPGGPLSLLALALLLAPGVAAIDGLARAARRGLRPARAVSWVAALAAPLLGALVTVYLLGLVGLIPRPAFPFDPALFATGFTEVLLMMFLLAAAIGGYWAVHLARPPRGATADVLVPAAGAFAFGGCLLAWLSNPFLGLLLVPVAHVWLLAARHRRPHLAILLAVLAVALMPFLLAGLDVRSSLGLSPWDVVLLVADGQIPALTAVALSLVVASLLGLAIANAQPREPVAARSPRRAGARAPRDAELGARP